MNPDYGKRVEGALDAIRQLHADTSRLLVDFGKTVDANWDSVFGNYVTRGLTYNVIADYWMAEGVYRYWSDIFDPAVVKALTVCFFGRGIAEPLLLVAQLNYLMEGGAETKTVCKEWDVWQLYFDWNDRPVTGEVMSSAGADKGRIKAAKLLAVPLYSITSVVDVVSLMSKVAL
jgi:hypothetical protein